MNIRDAALRYAERGLPVFPVRGKLPLTHHGFIDASTDADVIRGWFKQSPDANVAMPTGAASGLFVLDIDPRHGGDQSLAALEAKYGPLPATLEALTGGGGRHLFFASPQGQLIRNSAGKLGPGLDVRGDGGYVVVPPSVHPETKQTYRWTSKVKPAPAPAWLIEALTTTAPVVESAPDATIPAGQRNDTLARIAGAMRRKGCTPQAIEAALLAENARRCSPPLPESEVRGIAQSVSRYPSAPSASNAPRVEEPSGPPSQRRIVLIAADEFLKRTSRDERTWLVEGLLPASSQTIWQGRPKVGKSHSLLQLAFDMASGLPAFGRFQVPRATRCAYVELEEPESITKDRYAKMLRAHGGQGPNAENLRFFTREDLHHLHLLPRELLGSHLQNLISALRDGGSEMVILIALRRFLPTGHNLKDPEVAERINDALDAVLSETGAAIALANHDRKQEADTIEAQGFGSTFVSARADGSFDLGRAGGGIRRVRSEARFDTPEEFFLEKKPVGDGELIVWTDAPPDPKREKREEAKRLVAAGKSIREAAEAVGVSHTTVRNWLKDSEGDS